MNADDTTEYIPLPDGCEAIPDPRFGAFCYEKKTKEIVTRKPGACSPRVVMYKAHALTPEEVYQARLLLDIYDRVGWLSYYDPAKLQPKESPCP